VLPFIKSIPVYDNYGGIGVTAKGYRFDTESASKIAFAADFGIHIKIKPISNNLWMATSYKNFGDKIEISKSQELKLIENINYALRYNFEGAAKFAVTVDMLQFLSDNRFGYGVGAEISPVSAANLRIGWRDYNDSIFKGVTAGLFINFSSFNIGYSFVTMGKDYHPKHTVNIGFVFGWISDEYKASKYYLGVKFNEAIESYNKKDFITAKQCFEDILDIYPDHLPSKEYLRKIAIMLNNNDRLVHISISELLNKADLEFYRNDLIKSMRYYNEVLSLDPDNSIATKGIATIKAKRAKIEAQKNRKKYAEQIIALWNEAMELYNKENFVFAKEKFERIVDIDPENKGALKYLNIIKAKTDKVVKAQIDNIFKQAMQHYNAQEYDKAAKYFNAVYIADPTRIDAKDLYDKSIKANKNITSVREKSKSIK
jgi:tetratricopeptide (TPR) repeat protein